MTVRHVRVGDVLRLERTRLQPDPGHTYRAIGIYSWGKGIIENSPIQGSELSKVTYYRFPADALVLSNIQAWEAAIAVSDKRQAEEFIASQRFLPYVPVGEPEVDPRFLFHFFLSDPGMVLIRKASPGTVTRNRTLGINAFENLRIPLPNMATQQEIARRLDRLPETARRLTDIGATRVEFERSLRERLIHGDLQDRGTPGVRLEELLSESHDVVAVVANQTYRTAGIRNRGRGLFQGPELSTESTKYRSLRRLHAGQVMYSKLKAFEGAISVVPQQYDGFFTSHEFPTFAIRSDRVDVDYLRSVFMTTRFTELLAGGSKGVGARRERLPQAAFLALTVPLPSMETQRRIARRLDAVRQVSELSARQKALTEAIPQAARNEVFSRLA